ncbi:hypothetical protein [Rickettsia endosymbiont of Gonocerus acuteangulatus]|uniref:actin-based motility regulator RoaM n=1 Tax=Rickettsia endosymbiont of Gonocerus acuteangulatus TaxID=3066266 RepID=UPI0031332422
MSDITNELRHKFNSLKEKFSNVYTRSQADMLLGELSTLQNEAALYGLNFDISGLQQTLENKAKNFEVEQSIDKLQANEEAQKAAKLAEEERETAQKIATLNNFHDNFVTKIDKNLKQTQENNSHIEHVINKLEKEKIIDHEKLDAGILTHEEILSQHKDHKEFYEHHKRTNKEHICVHQELNELNKEITNLKQQLKQKNLSPEQINKLKQKLEFHQEMLKIRKPYAEKLEKAKKEADKKITEYEKARKVRGEKIEKLGNAIKIHHEKNPEKYSEAHQKYVALKNQHEAIETNGIVKDLDHHNKILGNINNTKSRSLTDKMKEQITVKDSIGGSLCPSRTPPNTSTNTKTRGI